MACRESQSHEQLPKSSQFRPAAFRHTPVAAMQQFSPRIAARCRMGRSRMSLRGIAFCRGAHRARTSLPAARARLHRGAGAVVIAMRRGSKMSHRYRIHVRIENNRLSPASHVGHLRSGRQTDLRFRRAQRLRARGRCRRAGCASAATPSSVEGDPCCCETSSSGQYAADAGSFSENISETASCTFGKPVGQMSLPLCPR